MAKAKAEQKGALDACVWEGDRAFAACARAHVSTVLLVAVLHARVDACGHADAKVDEGAHVWARECAHEADAGQRQTHFQPANANASHSFWQPHSSPIQHSV